MGKIELIDRFKMLERLQEWNTDDKQDSFLYSFALARIIEQPTVEAIPKEEERQFIESIQKIKDNHNEHGEPINYGTICGILIEGYRLLGKYMER